MRTKRVALGNVYAVLMLMLTSGTSALAQDYAVPASAARNIVKEERNRGFVVDFYERVFNKHDLKAVEDIVAENYIQHNPHFPTAEQLSSKSLPSGSSRTPRHMRGLYGAQSTVT
jgi:hypothetical protein